MDLFKFFEKLLNFMYPSFCVHCKEFFKGGSCLCPFCFDHLELLPKSTYVKSGVVFSDIGPARSLLYAYEKGAHHLAKTLAAFFLMQIEAFKWPQPQVVIASSQEFMEVAIELAQFLGCKVYAHESVGEQCVLMLVDRKENEGERRALFKGKGVASCYCLSFL
jgi:hypothetical protein